VPGFQGFAWSDLPMSANPKTARKSVRKEKTNPVKAEGHKFVLPEDVFFRLKMLAHEQHQTLSDCVVEVLDKALPKWKVDRIK
jgi:hypothetical protein